MRHREKYLRKFPLLLMAKTAILGLTDILFSPSRALLLGVDFVICFSSFLFFSLISPYRAHAGLTSPFVTAALLFAMAFCTTAMGIGYYERARRYSLYKVVTNGLLASLIALAISITSIYFFYYSVLGRLTFIWGACGAYLSITLFRLALSTLYRYIPYRFTLIGDSPILDELKDFFSQKNNIESRYFHYLKADNVFKLGAVAPGEHICDIVFSKQMLNSPEGVNIAIQAIKHKVRIVDENDFYTTIFERVNIEGISKCWIIQKGLHVRKIGTHFTMRVFDIVFAAIGLIITAPILFLIAISTKLTSPGSILFVQPRQGRFDTPFNMYKFRTMHQSASFLDARGGFTQAGDSRVTAIGCIIRPLHLDELPQLINILFGQMSVVGPRPEAVDFAKRMAKEIDLYEMRYLVKPGLTGHAQIMGGYCMDTVEDTKKKLAFDLYYLCNYNIFSNMRIIVRTFFVVLKQAALALKSSAGVLDYLRPSCQPLSKKKP